MPFLPTLNALISHNFTQHLFKQKQPYAVLKMLPASLLALYLTGCSNVNDDKRAQDNSADRPATLTADSALKDNNALYLLAGSELQDIEPFLPDIKAKTGISLKLDYTGTIDGAEAIAKGKQVDGAWFSHGKYLSLMNHKAIIEQQPIMLSPVLMSVRQSKAQQFGWLNADGKTPKADITWQNIADKSASGELKYAMTNPASSNSGFTALMGVVAALANTADAPSEADIAKAKPKLKAFFNGQTLTAGSSGWLADAFVKQQTPNQTNNAQPLDAMINYESVLLQLNQSGNLKEPLILLYPKEGIITADYPLMLMNSAKKPAYDKLVAYLKSAEFQQQLMEKTLRRPVNAEVKLTPNFHQDLVELPFPNAQSVIDSILSTYMNDLRTPARPTFILDTSGSMRGDGIKQLKTALNTLTEGDGSALSKYAKFADREQVTFIPFNSVTEPANTFLIAKANDPASLQPIKTYVNALKPSGGTAIYDALTEGYQKVAQDLQANNGEKAYYHTIVLMTDGQNGSGKIYEEFAEFYNSLPPNVKQVKTFTVLFGEADEKAMQQIADLTGGKVFDGRKDDLATVFKQIRAYQ